MKTGIRQNASLFLSIAIFFAFAVLFSTVSPADQNGDVYEIDNTFSQANVIVLNNTSSQRHNFHEARDEDWVKFYGIDDEIYEIKTSNLGSRCDTVIELYDTDGVTLLRGPWNWRIEGETELMSWTCDKDGIYYVRIYNDDGEIFGEETDYDLDVYRPVGPDEILWFVGGVITDVNSGQSIAGAQIITGENASAIGQPDGTYLMLHLAGTFDFTVSAPGYESITQTAISIPEGGKDNLDFQMTPLSQSARLYFPHVDTNLPWQTEIAVINTGDQAVTGTLRGYSDGGQPVGIGVGVSLSPGGRRQITVADEFTDHTTIGYIIFETDSDTVCGYTKFYKEGIYRTAIPAVKEINSSDIYVTHIDSGADWWTGISLVNTTSAAKDLVITFNNGQSTTVPLGANGHDAFTIAQLFGQPQTEIKSAVITNASGVIGLELFGSQGDSGQLDGLLLTDDTTRTLYYPHVESNGWWTGIVAYNPSDSESTITITPYKADGSPLATSTQPILGRQKYVGIVDQLGLPAETAWFRIDSTLSLSGFELFGTSDGSQLAAYAEGSGAGAPSGVFAKIEKNGGWTGIAFVNTEGSAATVTLTAYDDSGDPVAVEAILLDPHEKVVNMAEAIFSGQDITSATYIGYSSTGNVVGFQLNGSADGSMLDGLPGM